MGTCDREALTCWLFPLVCHIATTPTPPLSYDPLHTWPPTRRCRPRTHDHRGPRRRQDPLPRRGLSRGMIIRALGKEALPRGPCWRKAIVPHSHVESHFQPHRSDPRTRTWPNTIPSVCGHSMDPLSLPAVRIHHHLLLLTYLLSCLSLICLCIHCRRKNHTGIIIFFSSIPLIKFLFHSSFTYVILR